LLTCHLISTCYHPQDLLTSNQTLTCVSSRQMCSCCQTYFASLYRAWKNDCRPFT